MGDPLTRLLMLELRDDSAARTHKLGVNMQSLCHTTDVLEMKMPAFFFFLSCRWYPTDTGCDSFVLHGRMNLDASGCTVQILVFANTLRLLRLGFK